MITDYGYNLQGIKGTSPEAVGDIGGVGIEQTSGIGAADMSIANQPINPGVIQAGQLNSEINYVRGFLESSNFVTGVSGWQINSDGSAEFNDLYVRGTLITVSVGGDIQAAIDFLYSFGGGEVRLDVGTFNLTSDITLYSGIALVGSGLDTTILDFGNGAFGIKAIGASGSPVENWEVKNLTIQNSTAAKAFNCDGFAVTGLISYFSIDNVKIINCSGIGLYVELGDHFSINGLITDTVTGIGQRYFNSSYFVITNCFALDGGSIGFQTEDVVYTTLLNCTADTNGGDGFDIAGQNFFDIKLIGCTSKNNTGINFDIDDQCTLIGCFADDSAALIDYDVSWYCSLIGCSSETSAPNAINIQDTGTFYANLVGTYRSSSDTTSAEIFKVGDQLAGVAGNIFVSALSDKKYIRMKNTSGGAISNGSVVILKSVAAGDEVTTTTSAGDDKVFGIAYGDMTSNRYGQIQVTGKNIYVKVDGTTDIAVGDYLTTFTTAGIAAKAGAGDMVFAMALEAYTGNDSNGVIDALIINPRLI